MASARGIWDISEINEQIRKQEWVEYSHENDPNTIWGFGYNAQGELALNDTANRSSPVQVPGIWCHVSVGENFLGVKENGTLWISGNNNHKQIGSPTPAFVSSPVQIPGSTWKNVEATNGWGTLYATKIDNTLWAWGLNSDGQLGVNDRVHRSSPTQIPGTNWCEIKSWSNHNLALRVDNTLWTWGKNDVGSLGLNDRVHRSSPTQIPGTDWCKIAVGNYFNLALRTDNTLWAWGLNSDGQLGTNARVHRSSPVQIPGTSWCDIGIGNGTSLGIRTDNTLWAWGLNSDGQLGIDDRLSRSSPVQIPGSAWKKLSTGFHNCSSYATKTDNTLWAWGLNSIGQLGVNDRVHRSSPVQIPGTDWKNLTSGYSRVIASKFL